MSLLAFTELVGTERLKIKPDPETWKSAVDRVITQETTYFLNDDLHCSRWRRRSLIDICRVVLNYFDVPIQDIIDYIAEKLVKGTHYSFVCCTIKRQVVDVIGNSMYFRGNRDYKDYLYQEDLKEPTSVAAHLLKETIDKLKTNK